MYSAKHLPSKLEHTIIDITYNTQPWPRFCPKLATVWTQYPNTKTKHTTHFSTTANNLNTYPQQSTHSITWTIHQHLYNLTQYKPLTTLNNPHHDVAILSVICTWPYYQSFVHGHIVGSYCPNSNANTTGHIQKPAFTKKIETFFPS